jgi:hypothetical protein
VEPEHHAPVEIEPQRPAVRFTRRVAIAAPFDLTQHIVSYTIIWTIFTAKCGTIRGMRVNIKRLTERCVPEFVRLLSHSNKREASHGYTTDDVSTEHERSNLDGRNAYRGREQSGFFQRNADRGRRSARVPGSDGAKVDGNEGNSRVRRDNDCGDAPQDNETKRAYDLEYRAVTTWLGLDPPQVSGNMAV